MIEQESLNQVGPQKGAEVLIDQVRVILSGQEILKGISLRVEPGTCLALLGPSGCGKSTLLRTIIGLVTPHSGRVTIHGQLMSRETSQKLRKEIGFCVQDGGLFPHLNLEQNVTLMAGLLRWSPSQISNRLEELLELTQMSTSLLKRFPNQVSGGQRQRVSLMRSLFLNPSLILLDEPMGALDPMVRSELQDELKSIFKKLGKTVILVTHDLSEAAYLGQSLVLMRAGEIVQQGSTRDLIDRPRDRFVTQYIRSQRAEVLL